jgi:hypothetical protein
MTTELVEVRVLARYIQWRYYTPELGAWWLVGHAGATRIESELKPISVDGRMYYRCRVTPIDAIAFQLCGEAR